MMDEKQQDSTVKASILGVNNLSYVLQPDLSVAVSRVMTKQFPQSQKHVPRDTMIFTLNSGSAFVDFKNSYLSIDVTNTSTATPPAAPTAFFGQSGGSACNLFNRLTITSRSGQILERIDRVNQLSAIRVLYERSSNWHQTVGSMMGVAPPLAIDSNAAASALLWGIGTTIRFIIPLGALSVFFNTTNQLMPCQLASGMRIELTCEDAGLAMMQNAAATANGYEIVAASLNLQSYLLSDVVLRTLNEASASSGLEVVHETVYSAIGQRSTTMYNAELTKAASRCLKAVYHERKITTVAPFLDDDFASPIYSSTYFVSELQYRLGSIFFPNTSIRGDTFRQSAPELFAQTLQAFGHMAGSNPNLAVTESKFRTGMAAYAQSFERSDVLDLAGQPSSNSRIINLVARFTDTLTRETEFYLFYAQLIRVFSSNCVVEQ